MDSNGIILLRVFMALHFISLHVSRIATELYYCEWTWHYTLFPYLSALLQQNYVITVKHGITIYFLTRLVDCNEIILLRVVMALQFISLHVRWIATKLYHYG